MFRELAGSLLELFKDLVGTVGGAVEALDGSDSEDGDDDDLPVESFLVSEDAQRLYATLAGNRKLLTDLLKNIPENAPERTGITALMTTVEDSIGLVIEKSDYDPTIDIALPEEERERAKDDVAPAPPQES